MFRIIQHIKSGLFQVQVRGLFGWKCYLFELDEGDWWQRWFKTKDEALRAYEQHEMDKLREKAQQAKFHVVCWWDR